ncbi:MAG TPA: hypothetical protein VLI72_14390, partial [Methylibium sp.]|nr:hypothetical protein [Methylibium sp.]
MLAQVTGHREVLAPGTAIGSFVLQSVLDRDAFAVRYAATASASGADVVIEEYLPERIAVRAEDGQVRPRDRSQAALFEAGLQAFIEEAGQLSRLNHPSLLRIGPIWRTLGTAFRLRLALPGDTLSVLRAQMVEPPDEAWLRRLFEPIAAALQCVHDAGLVHDDVRPGKIVLGRGGDAMLLDFGAPCATLTAIAPWQATWPEPGFRPPETRDARQRPRLGRAIDIFGLAAVLRFCITGEAPGPGARDAAGRTVGSLADELGRRRHRVAVSDRFIAAIDVAMSVDPGDRPQTIAELREALDRTALPPRPPPEPLRPPWMPSPVAGAASRDARVTRPAAVETPAAPPWRDGLPPATAVALGRDERAPAARTAEPDFAPTGAAAPRADVRPYAPPPARSRWPSALGGVLVGAAMMAAAALALPPHVADEARRSWQGVLAELLPVQMQAPSPMVGAAAPALSPPVAAPALAGPATAARADRPDPLGVPAAPPAPVNTAAA